MADSQEQPTRAAILKFLKIHGPSEVKGIAGFCGLTAVAVRRHLLNLQADGLVETEMQRHSQGRPAKAYALSELGDAQFARDYAGLIVDLLSCLERLDGSAKVQAVFRKRRSDLAARSRGRMLGKGLEARVRETAAVLTECGYMAEARRDGPGCFLLTEHNCTIRDVAQCYPVACQEELSLIRELTGGKVTRVSHLLSGERQCSYLIQRPQRERDRGPESRG